MECVFDAFVSLFCSTQLILQCGKNNKGNESLIPRPGVKDE